MSKSESRNEAVLKELIGELSHVRMAFHEALAVYGVRVEGRLSQILATLEDLSSSASDGKAGKRGKEFSGLDSPVFRDVADMLAILKDLNLKPEKGRRKDLRHVDEAASNLQTRIDDW